MLAISPSTFFASQTDARDITLMSYNILLPNAAAGWWVYKYYAPEQQEYSTWEYRKQLFVSQFAHNTDLICLQECAEESYREDLDFLLDRYDLLCHKRANIAMVTGWKREKFSLIAEHHENRCLVSVLREVSGLHIAVVNCHLSAGRHPRERFQQLHQALDRVRKEKNKQPLDLIILAGDCNASPNGTAVQRFLEDGVIETRFREDRYPHVQITSTDKEHSLGRFVDCYREIRDGASMWARNSTVLMVDEKGRWQRRFIEAMEELFSIYTQSSHMSVEEMERWIVECNQGLRGSEYRNALERMTEKGLSKEDFIEIHKTEVLEGKQWAVYNFLAQHNIALGVPKPLIGKYQLDQVWLRSSVYECTGVVPPISMENKQKMEQGDFPPNKWHPSDHFPLYVRFSKRVF